MSGTHINHVAFGFFSSALRPKSQTLWDGYMDATGRNNDALSGRRTETIVLPHRANLV